MESENMAVNFLSSANLFNIMKQYVSMSQNPCPDQLYGQYCKGHIIQKCNRDDVDYNLTKRIATYKSNGIITNRVIAIVLESPHKHEYNATTPIGPAQHTTGKLFQKEFHKLFPNSLLYANINSNSVYDIVLLNSVQFQCSFGMSLTNRSNKINRDNTWIDIFQNYGGNIDIVDRINALNPAIVINLCTKGIYNLQLLLDVQLRAHCSMPYTFGTHPSTWNFSSSRIY